MKLSMIAAAAASMMLFATAAHAQTTAGWIEGPTTVIHTAKLDLNRPEDREVLLYRIERAVHAACAIQPSRAAQKSCQTEKFDKVMATSPRIRDAVEMARLERGEVQVFASR